MTRLCLGPVCGPAKRPEPQVQLVEGGQAIAVLRLDLARTGQAFEGLAEQLWYVGGVGMAARHGLGTAQLTNPKIGRVWFYEGETLAFRTLHVDLPRSGVIFAVALNSQPTVDHIGDLAVSVHDTLVEHGVMRPTAHGTALTEDEREHLFSGPVGAQPS